MTTLSHEQLLQRLIDQDPEHAVILLDTAGIIIGWYGAAERILGYSASEVIGQRSSMLFSPEDIDKQMPQFEMDVARADRQAEDDRWMLRKDGLRIWVTGILMPLRGEDGQLLAFGKVLRNRTDLKARLDALESQIAALGKSNEQKNNFISTLAHEIRNPLTAILNSIELLNEIGSPDDRCHFARSTIRRQVDFMKRLVEDLLEVTRIGAGKIQLRKQLIRLNDVVLSAVETCQPALNEHTHDFELVMPDAPITIEADADRLRQVFVNLIHNAARYTEYGGHIWVKVSVEGTDAVAKVEDDGIGISPEMMPQIFELFTQSEFSAGQKTAGLGIGLSVVKDLVTLHGGTVQVRSDGIGRGSEFTVRLPLKGADAKRPDGPFPIG